MIVTAALIPSDGRLFVAQRPPWKKFGALWEFPGGKVESGEGLEESLVREIREELCIDIHVRGFFKTLSHSRGDFTIDLHTYWCAVYGGKIRLTEHTAFKWASLSELKTLPLTEADRLLIPYLENLLSMPVFTHSFNA
jgi:8-oxo-dGTP diphosphatase